MRNAIKWHTKISSLVKVGAFKNLKNINDNAYQLQLSSHIHTFDVFNVKHLIPYCGNTFDNELPNLRANSFVEGGTNPTQNIVLEYLNKRDKLKVYKRNHKGQISH
ncbi:hypothetical protein AMTRI_Chr10g3020 [Amborella trichopoda]